MIGRITIDKDGKLIHEIIKARNIEHGKTNFSVLKPEILIYNTDKKEL